MSEKDIPQELIFNVDDFYLGSKIGFGSYGDVYLAENKNTNELYAAKISKNPSDSEKFKFDEVLILSKNHYPALIELKGYSPVNFAKHNYPVLFFEFSQNGSLFDYFREGPKDDTSSYIFLLGIAIGLNKLHNDHFIHRDIKPANIIIDNNYHPLVSDFGISKKGKREDDAQVTLYKTLNVGSPLYMAPEINVANPYTRSADIYSYSMVAYQIITDKLPFYDKQFRSIYALTQNVLRGVRPTITEIENKYVRDFLEACWNPNPQERPAFNDIINMITNKEFYSYFKNLNCLRVIEYLKIFGDEFNEIQKKFDPSINRDLLPEEISMIHQIVGISEDEIKRIYKEIINENVKNEIQGLAEALEQPLFIIEFFYQFTGGDQFKIIDYLTKKGTNDVITEG